jgi:hypothetical protein
MDVARLGTSRLEKRLAGWQALLTKPTRHRFFTQGEIERAIAELEHELGKRAEVAKAEAKYSAERTE